MVSGLPLGDRSLFNSIVHKLIVSEIAAPMESAGLSVKAAVGACLSLDGLPGRKYLCCPGYNLQQWHLRCMVLGTSASVHAG